MMNIKEAADLLNGREYTKEITRDEEAAFKAAGLVALFGARDDLAEFRGAWREEVGAYEGCIIYVNAGGPLTSECDDERFPYLERAKANARQIESVRAGDGFPLP